MVKRKGGFLDYVETENDCMKCVFCGFVFGGPFSISKIKSHLSGVGMCRNVPSPVKAAASEASPRANKRLKTIPSSSNENEIGDMEHMKSNIEKLKNEAEKLKNERSSLQRRVEEATKNGDKIEDNVGYWLTRADQAIQDANELIRQGEEIEANGSCPNCQQLSQKAENVASAIGVLQNERNFTRISYPVPLKEILSSAVDGYQALDSRELKLKEVMDALRDPNVNMIGLHGMGGIGKTTLAKEIAKRAMEEKLFDVVVMATVFATPKLKEIQQKIADIFRVEFKEETESGRAARLQQLLTEEVKKRNILIILDDLWVQLKLEEVGILFGNDGKGCKILLTSRNLHVLSNEMRTQKAFYLGGLSPKEAWRLFEKTTGGVKSPELQPVATKVVEKCAGLPISIVTVAAALKDKPIHVWKDALKQLSGFDNEGIQAKTHTILKYSYDRLDGGVQPFFLLCGLLGKSDISIDDLLIYSMGMDLFKRIDTVEDARNRVLTLISQLKDSCLLQDGDRNGFVKMHDVLREVAVSIASTDQHAVTDSDDIGSKGWPDKDTLKRCTRISLPYCDIHDIPDGMECPEVELFLLFTKDRLLEVPDQLFKGFKKLKVMSFAGMRFPSLPPSLGGLTNLQTLCLNDCMLSDVAIVGALKKLEILSFKDSNIAKLPREIEQLTRLKRLDLSNCSCLEVIPANVISKLTILEELYIRNSFDRWEVTGSNNQSNASLAELEHLTRLSALEIRVPDVKVLPKDFLSKELERCKISIGRWRIYWHEMETSRDLELSSSIFSVNGVKVLLKGTESLSLKEVAGIKNILNDLDSNGFQQLKQLLVDDCCDVQFLTSSYVSFIAVPKLEFLSLHGLSSLEKFCDGQLIEGSFRALRSLTVSYCHKLKNLFTFSMVLGLSQLRKLYISSCHGMKVIVADDMNNKNKVVEFPQLISLTLGQLYLTSFFLEGSGPSTSQLLSWPLFSKQVSFPSLEKLSILDMPCERIWDEGQLSQISPNITEIEVSGCNNLKYLLPPSAVTSLLQLQRLSIGACDLMKEVILSEEERTDTIIFSKLEHLSLRRLPKVARFCCGSLIKCQSLKRLEIQSCHALETFISNSTTDVTFNNEPKEVKSRHTKIQSLFDEKVEFPNLQEMILNSCAKIKIVFSSNDSRGFYKVEKLEVTDCNSLKMIYHLAIELNVEKTSFNLREMRLVNLPKLKYIWSKDPQETHGEVQLQRQQNWVEKVFPNLENLRLDTTATVMILGCGFSTRFFSKIKFLHIEKFWDNVAVLRLLGKLHDLEVLSLRKCHVKELFSFSCEGNREYAWKLPRIRSLCLGDLHSLNHIWMQEQDYSQLASIEHLDIYDCGNLINLAPSSVSFKNLTTLKVASCKGLLNLVTLSVAKSFVQLTTMEIWLCESLTEIIADGIIEEEEEGIIFYKLKTLKLDSLKKLTCFCSGSCSLKFPFLEEVTVKYCYNLRIFSHGDVSTPKLVNVSTPNLVNWLSERIKWNWEGDLNSTIQHLYMEMVGIEFHSITSLKLSEFSLVKQKWQCQLPLPVPDNLRSLEVDDCTFISFAVPLNAVTFLKQLEGLVVKKCDSVEEVVDWEGLNEYEGLTHQLSVLHLIDLPKLRHVWNKHPRGTLDFKKLTVLKVHNCGNLKFIFTLPMALSLMKLSRMEIKGCPLVQEIITKGGDQEEALVDKEATFPSLWSVELECLPELTTFYSGTGVLKCPLVTTIGVVECPKTELFTSTITKREDSSTSTPVAPFFGGKVEIPCLKILRVDWDSGTEDIWSGRCEVELPCSLISIELIHFFGDSAFLASNFLQKLHSLEEFVLNDSIFEEINLHDVVTFTQVRNLKMSKLPKLKHLVKANSQPIPIFQHLETLKVLECGGLKLLFPSSTSLRNLITLEVSNCHGLINLITSSTARSLAQLKFLWIKECELVEEIVAGDGEVVEDAIAFKQLENLELHCLACLTCFSSSHYIFNFPSLKRVTVTECPKMENFAQEGLSTPKLSWIRAEGECPECRITMKASFM